MECVCSDILEGRLMKIEEAPKALRKKYYSKHLGKEVNEYEWTVTKKYILTEIQRLDKEFRKSLRKNKEKFRNFPGPKQY